MCFQNSSYSFFFKICLLEKTTNFSSYFYTLTHTHSTLTQTHIHTAHSHRHRHRQTDRQTDRNSYTQSIITLLVQVFICKMVNELRSIRTYVVTTKTFNKPVIFNAALPLPVLKRCFHLGYQKHNISPSEMC